MSAKEYLLQVGIIDAQLKTIDANIERLRRELEALDDISLSSSWTDGQPHGTKTSDPTGSKAVKLADSYNAKRIKLKDELLQLEYEQLITRSKLWSARMEVCETIEKIIATKDPMAKTYYRILTMRYVEGESWEQIAVDIGYTWRHTIRLHGEALKRMEKIL